MKMKPQLTVIVNKDIIAIEERFDEIEKKFYGTFGDYIKSPKSMPARSAEQIAFLSESIRFISGIMYTPLILRERSKVTGDMMGELYSKMAKWADAYGIEIPCDPISAILC